MLLPWFEGRTSSGRSHTYTPWPWGDPDAAAAPDWPFLSLQIAELVFRREWGLSFVIAAASGALISFISAGWRPTHPRIPRVIAVNLIAAAVAVLLVVLMALAFASGAPAGTSIAPRIGFFVGAAAVIGWLGAGIAVARIAATARAAAEAAPPTP
jgi:hypothetical protein